MIRNFGRLDVFPDTEALAQGLADFFVNASETAITERGGFYVALAGGTTPCAAYELLAQEPLVSRISWPDVYVYFGDERCVQPIDPLSNYLTARETLLDRIEIPAHNIHRMRGEIPPAEGAAEYAKILREDLADLRFDLVMLGMGKDGHTASLFPGSDPLTDDDRLVRTTYSEATGTDRITITPMIINAARSIAMCTAGPEKAAALAHVREGEYNPTKYPAQIVAPSDGQYIWLVDELAVGMLKQL
jgi:6-phosphogluconolactonase